MLLDDYRAQQRTDLRDVGGIKYFEDAELDLFHRRALDEYARYKPFVKPMTLDLVAGTEAVPLPDDLIAVDPRSFQQALGIPGGYVPVRTGYGTIFQLSNDAAAPTVGMEADFRGYLGPFGGTPCPPATTYTFLDGAPPQLIIRPAPAASGSYPIFYQADYALPTDADPGNLPDRDAGIVLDFACHLACEAMLSDPTLLQSYKITDEAIDRKQVVAAIQEKSRTKRASFDRWTLQRPLGGLA